MNNEKTENSQCRCNHGRELPSLVRVVNKSGFEVPEYKTPMSSGVDLKYSGEEEYTLQPLERKLFETGLYIQLEPGYEATVRPRSGLALKHGITVLNSPGTVDADYRGEVGVILINLSDEPYTITPGDRIAQMVVGPYRQVEFLEVYELSETERGECGFGHTGK